MELERLVTTYLRSAGYSVRNSLPGEIVADRPGVGGERNTINVWLPATMFPGRAPREVEPSLVDRLDHGISTANGARIMLVESQEGINRSLREELSKRNIRIRVPIQFFDAPFKMEDAPEVASAIKIIRSEESVRRRIPQPYLKVSSDERGDDLLVHLRHELTGGTGPRIIFVIGSAGAGKSVLFNSLFTIVYRDFLDAKQRQRMASRPMPILPDHLRGSYGNRLTAVIDSFMRSEVATPVSTEVCEWMLQNGLCTWMCDGLDEMYAGDPEFFDYLLDQVTSADSRARILICARDSLLTSNDSFAQFLRSFEPGKDPVISVYRLSDWDEQSKRRFAYRMLHDTTPSSRDGEPPQVKAFLQFTHSSPSAEQLTGLAYYCEQALQAFKDGRADALRSEAMLVGYAIERMIAREKEKGLIDDAIFERDGLNEWLEQIGMDYCNSKYAGVNTDDIRNYGDLVLRSGLSDSVRDNAIISLVQFPLFTSNHAPGRVSFSHELLAEYLFGKKLWRTMQSDVKAAANAISDTLGFKTKLGFRYLAEHLALSPTVRDNVVALLRSGALNEKEFALLLQLWTASSTSGAKLPTGVSLEGRPLEGLVFDRLDLSDVSFRSADLTDATFRACDLQKAAFDWAQLAGTKFEALPAQALNGAQFGDMDHFEYVYVNGKLIETRDEAGRWVRSATGIVEPKRDPCPTSQQVRALFLKYVFPDGNGRRDELKSSALTRGRRIPNAPSPEDCVTAAVRNGFLTGPDYRNRLRRAAGSQYDEVVEFVRDWRIGEATRGLLTNLCPIAGCTHVPPDFGRKER